MSRFSSRRSAGGFTLVELMIAIVLGLIVSGAALTVFVTNRQTYAATESLGRIQENARTGFELMARDLRQASGSVCRRSFAPIPQIILLDDLNANTDWYAGWNEDSSTGAYKGIFGYDGSTAMSGLAFGAAAGQRASGTDGIELRGAMGGDDVSIVPPTSLDLNNIRVRDASGFNRGDLVVACDPEQIRLFQLTGKTGNVVNRAVVTTPAPGNSRQVRAFGCFSGTYDADCASGANTWPASLARFSAVRWYVGANDHGSRSLYRVSLVNNSGSLGTRTDEIAEGVQDMQLEYLIGDAVDYVPADSVAVADWSGGRVMAVRLRMTISDSERTGTDHSQISRVLEHTIALRNRTP